VVDIGANIGCHTVPIAKAVAPHGSVLAFEPQPRIFQLLAANITINGLANARLFQPVVEPSPQPSAFRDELQRRQQLGAVRLGHLIATNGLAANRRRRPARAYPFCPRRGLRLDRLRLIKIDVEGMELESCAEPSDYSTLTSGPVRGE